MNKGVLLKIVGWKEQEKGLLGYEFGASFFRQTWGKVSAMYSQIKDVMREENRENTASL